MKKIVRLTEHDLVRLIKKVINEETVKSDLIKYLESNNYVETLPNDINNVNRVVLSRSDIMATRLNMKKPLKYFKNSKNAIVFTDKDGKEAVIVSPYDGQHKYTYEQMKSEKKLESPFLHSKGEELDPNRKIEILRSLAKEPNDTIQ